MSGMMDKLMALLRSPYPVLGKRWKTVVLPSLLVFFILYFLEPFGISRMEGAKLPVLSGFALVSAAMIAVVVCLLPALFPAWHREERWTLGKDLLSTLLICVLITLGNWCYTAWMFSLPLNLSLLAVCLLWMLVISPFPILIFMMWNRNLQLRHNLQEAMEMNARLAERLREETAAGGQSGTDSPRVVLAGGTKETFTLDADTLLYAEAEGNYVRLNCLSADGGKRTSKLLRITMKQAEESLAGCIYIIRCHRAYLVNLKRVLKVSGNAQGYRLHLEGCEEAVPVSRAYARAVKGYFEKEG